MAQMQQIHEGELKMNTKYEKLKNLLKELFQLDQPDLDFGIYRIMHAKSDEVTKFLDEELLPQVKEAFSHYKPADRAALQKELDKAIEQARGLGVDPEAAPAVKELRAKIANEAIDLSALEAEVYDHLYNFFRRYYHEGDFLSLRRYKEGVYAIPYEGEEVKLYWANHDQYYIKTSEYLRDYAFRLQPDNDTDPMRVHFRLVDAAEGEHNNAREANGKQRVFVLAPDDFIAEEDGEQGKELIIRFEYRPATLADWPEGERDGKDKPPAQKDLIEIAEKRVLSVDDVSFAKWIESLRKPHIKANGERADYSRLRAHLNRYTARNTFDYFIHKDLGGFLRRELDFYIKNEVMHLDDIESETAPRVEQYLSKIKVIRKIANKIIDFLAQLEDFQKKLWLKRKFVTETSWCVSLKTILAIEDTETRDALLQEIATNDAQREEWVRLHAIDELSSLANRGAAAAGQMSLDEGAEYSVPLSLDFLAAHPTLMVDTRHFDSDFTMRLLEAIDDIDEKTDGLLIHGENFQALNLLQARYREQVKCIYIDPPYNTGSDEFLYRDNYQHSSWLAMMENRLNIANNFLMLSGVAFINIDEREQARLEALLERIFGYGNSLGPFIWLARAGKAVTERQLQIAHEYVLSASKSLADVKFKLVENKVTGCRYHDERGGYNRELLRQWGGQHDRREDRPTMYFPIPSPFGGEVYPKRPDGSDGCWRASREQVEKMLQEGDLDFVRDERTGEITVYRKVREGTVTLSAPSNILDDCGTSATATTEVKRLFTEKTFDTAKPVNLAKRCISLVAKDNNSYVLDYFAGSGTTGHAVINLNREDGGRRKFILVEMADYFDTVLLPRLKKVTFTPEWKDGKPKRLPTPEEAERSPRLFKVIRLESYEDTLNNLELRRTQEQQSLLDLPQAQGPDGLKEQYILRYMLDTETRGSASLLNIDAFSDPTSYKLKVKVPGSDESRWLNVDLIETFNYLIGLRVAAISAPQTFAADFERDGEGRLRLKGRLKPDPAGPNWFRSVSGTLADGRKVLVIWRKRPGGEDPLELEKDNLVLDEWFKKQGYSSKDSEFDLIFVNGGNNLENLKTPDDTWKVRLIEEDFFRLMFDVEGA